MILASTWLTFKRERRLQADGCAAHASGARNSDCTGGPPLYDAVMNINDRYGPLPHDPDEVTRRCRLLQSWYRVEVLKIEKCGPWRLGENLVGSSLVDGEVSGANFISPEAFAYAKQRVADKEKNTNLTIDEFRLFNNMLSSMPMCFNLFADFRAAAKAGWANCTQVLRTIFDTSRIHRVDDVVVEEIPCHISEYIDDKTGLDAAIFYVDSDGGKGLASIETKYTDKLGTNRASKEDKKLKLAEDLGLFCGDALQWYKEHHFDQVARNLLLTLAYQRNHGLAHAKNYVLAPKCDHEGLKAVSELKGRLAPQYEDSIELLPLETVVERGLTCADGFFTDHLNRFQRRYLDFSQIANL
jgi:hypothetical protein